MELSVLPRQKIEEIHQASLAVLEKTGVVLEDRQARQMLFDHGASERNRRVCLPPDLVTGCLENAPTQVTLRGRGSQITLGDGSLHVHNLGGARDVFDPMVRKLRPASASDVAESARLLDALEQVSSITPLYTPRDVPPALMSLYMFAQTVSNTLKPINGPGLQTAQEVQYMVEMIQIVFGEQPAVSLAVSPVSPLHLPPEIARAAIEIARSGMPFGPLPCPNLGATAPITLAGALTQQNAENLALFTLARLVNPDLPLIYCGRLAALDMRTFSPAWGNPEIGLAGAAAVQIGHFYNLPVNVYGLATSVYSMDIQNGYERALNAILPVLAGADEISGVGEMAGGIFSCSAQMVVDNELLGMLQRLRAGFRVDDDTLALDLIDQVMGDNVQFSGSAHTVRHLRLGEVWHPKFGRLPSSFDSWCDSGAETILDHAQRKADMLLREHRVPPLADDQSAAVEKMLARLSG